MFNQQFIKERKRKREGGGRESCHGNEGRKFDEPKLFSFKLFSETNCLIRHFECHGEVLLNTKYG